MNLLGAKMDSLDKWLGVNVPRKSIALAGRPGTYGRATVSHCMAGGVKARRHLLPARHIQPRSSWKNNSGFSNWS